ncbi:hypothetical protein KSC_016470 [Ktedonobacter sp. SOSP1-52]|nr:hypothetical protein KSC_016470 [Ktedonobacter sp. SOSP1-52]
MTLTINRPQANRVALIERDPARVKLYTIDQVEFGDEHKPSHVLTSFYVHIETSPLDEGPEQDVDLLKGQSNTLGKATHSARFDRLRKLSWAYL